MGSRDIIEIGSAGHLEALLCLCLWLNLTLVLWFTSTYELSYQEILIGCAKKTTIREHGLANNVSILLKFILILGLTYWANVAFPISFEIQSLRRVSEKQRNR